MISLFRSGMCLGSSSRRMGRGRRKGRGGLREVVGGVMGEKEMMLRRRLSILMVEISILK